MRRNIDYWKWHEVSRQVLERDKWRCRSCKQPGCGLRHREQRWHCQVCDADVGLEENQFEHQWDRCQRRLEVDHIRPPAQGGQPYFLGNLQVLCRGCRDLKADRELDPQTNPALATKAWKIMQEQAAKRTGRVALYRSRPETPSPFLSGWMGELIFMAVLLLYVFLIFLPNPM